MTCDATEMTDFLPAYYVLVASGGRLRAGGGEALVVLIEDGLMKTDVRPRDSLLLVLSTLRALFENADAYRDVCRLLVSRGIVEGKLVSAENCLEGAGWVISLSGLRCACPSVCPFVRPSMRLLV